MAAIEIKTATLIGSGNVASWFADRLKKAKIVIPQIYSRQWEHAKALAESCDAEAVNELEHLRTDSDIYILSVKDDAYEELLQRIPFRMQRAVITAGSVSQSILEGHADCYGVLYPCQSISKGRNYDQLQVPLCIEGDSPITQEILLQFGRQLSPITYAINERQRTALHTAAVFANNFPNALYGISFGILQDAGIEKDTLIPLMQMTLDKVRTMTPEEAQTGPAQRGDTRVIEKQMNSIADKNVRKIYKACTERIENQAKKSKQMDNYRQKLKHITTFIFDFDGVLSNGSIWVTPDGDQLRATDSKDGYALQYALKKGYHVAIISGGYSETMRMRFQRFTGMEIYMKASDKVEILSGYMAQHQLKQEQILVMGDDIPDMKMMQMGAIKCCPADACEEVKGIADYISFKNGGRGAVRDVIEQTLKAQNRWMEEDACIW